MAAGVGHARVCPGGFVRPHGRGLQGHEVLEVAHHDTTVLSGPLVGPLYRVFLPVGPVDVLAKHRQPERVRENFLKANQV